MRYFIHLAYDGTAYCGWQVQPGVPTVQAALNLALSNVLRQPVST
ncbi:MAG: tRNA pseudouridine(38-40) synthase TruA, partial [Hymenobacter sp.]